MVSIVPIPTFPKIVAFKFPETYKFEVVEVVPMPILFVNSDVVFTLPFTEPQYLMINNYLRLYYYIQHQHKALQVQVLCLMVY